MKKAFFIAFLFCSFYAFSQEEMPYKIGEYAKYKISFGPIWVGHATLEIKEALEENNQDIVHVIGKGNTAPFFDYFFKVHFKTFNYIQDLNRKLEGIRDGKMISYKYFSEIKLPYPCIEEQQKLANFLSAIDAKIDLVSTQIENTQAFKKGLLQQMFV